VKNELSMLTMLMLLLQQATTVLLTWNDSLKSVASKPENKNISSSNNLKVLKSSENR